MKCSPSTPGCCCVTTRLGIRECYTPGTVARHGYVTLTCVNGRWRQTAVAILKPGDKLVNKVRNAKRSTTSKKKH
jgi:hypothetical protein